MLYETAVVVSS